MIPQPTTRTLFEFKVAAFHTDEKRKINAIAGAVFEAANIKTLALSRTDSGRQQWLVDIKAVGQYMVYCNSSLSLTASSTVFGKTKDHATVLNAIEKVQGFIDGGYDGICDLYERTKNILKNDYAIEIKDVHYKKINKKKFIGGKVEKLTIYGKPLEIFNSYEEAAKSVQIKPSRISTAISQDQIVEGFRWRFLGDKIFLYKPRQIKHEWRIIQSSLENDEIAQYKNITQAGKALSLNPRSLNRAMARKEPIAGFWFEKKLLPVKTMAERNS